MTKNMDFTNWWLPFDSICNLFDERKLLLLITIRFFFKHRLQPAYYILLMVDLIPQSPNVIALIGYFLYTEFLILEDIRIDISDLLQFVVLLNSSSISLEEFMSDE